MENSTDFSSLATTNMTDVDTSTVTTSSFLSTSVVTTSSFVPTSFVTTTNNTMNDNGHNMTREDVLAYLEKLQDEEFLVFLPTLSFITLTAVLGLIGNPIVLLVYKLRFTKSPKRVFIMAIAVFDLIGNLVVVPLDIYRIFNLWNYTNAAICRSTWFIACSTYIISGFYLVGLAIDRYLKICRPFGKQMTERQAKIMVIGFGIFGCSLTILYGIITGIHTRPTPIPGIFGYSCSIADDYLFTIWPIVNNVLFLLIFLFMFLPIAGIYTAIGIQAFKHRKRPSEQPLTKTTSSGSSDILSKPSSTHSDDIDGYPKEVRTGSEMQENSNNIAESSVDDTSSTVIDPRTDHKSEDDVKVNMKVETNAITKSEEDITYVAKTGQANKSVKKSGATKSKGRGFNRITVMLLLITFIFMMTYLPYLTVVFIQFVEPETFMTMGPTSLAIYHLSIHMGTLNNAANAIIYSLCDLNFRREALKLLRC